MNGELKNLATLIEENTRDHHFCSEVKYLDDSLDKLYESHKILELQTQKDLFHLSMKCYTLFSLILRRDLVSIPELLKYSLLSKCFHSEGIVIVPNSAADEVYALIKESDQDWYENQAVGIRIFNLRYKILEDPSLDVEILGDQFENTGDPTDVRSILRNPNCPTEFLQSIIESDHFIFEDREDEELINEAKSILSSRL